MRRHQVKNVITSYGIINVKIDSEQFKEHLISKYSSVSVSASVNGESSKTISIDSDQARYGDINQLLNVNYLLASRKHSLGFVQLVRGLYDETSKDSVTSIFKQLYPREVTYIRRKNFDLLMSLFFDRISSESSYVAKKPIMINTLITGRYQNEYIKSNEKFSNLLAGKSANGRRIKNIDYYLNNVHPDYQTLEWGFPKGRKEQDVDELTCACREFQEETGYDLHEYTVLNLIEPIVENMTGTNNVKYKHIYYIALDQRELSDSSTSPVDTVEIDTISWFNYDDAIKTIRPFHIEKKQMIKIINKWLFDEWTNQRRIN